MQETDIFTQQSILSKVRKRQILAQKLENESFLVKANSMSILKEFESIEYES